MTRVLITGAMGMLGSDLVETAQRLDLDIYALARQDLDVTDPIAVQRTIENCRPEIVINCAAWTDVDGAESHPDEARAINATGAGNIAAAASNCGAFTVQISTDYVFSGDKSTGYREDAATGPKSIYGQTKLQGEIAVAKAAPGMHAIVRTSWLFGVNGANFVDTILNHAREKGQLRVVDDQIGCPTWTGHLAEAVIEVALNRSSGIVHLAGAGSCSWFDLAKAAVESEELECEIIPVTSSEFPRPAPRPGFSALVNTRNDIPTLPLWQEGLLSFMNRRKNSPLTTASSAAISK